MAATVRYADFNLSGGTNNGLTKATAWETWADVAAGAFGTGGRRVYFNPKSGGGRFSATSGLVVTPNITSMKEPLILEGMDFSTDLPALVAFDLGSNKFEVGCEFLELRYFDLTSSNNDATIDEYSSTGMDGLIVYRCVVANTSVAATGALHSAIDLTDGQVIDSILTNAYDASTSYVVRATSRCSVQNCVINAAGGGITSLNVRGGIFGNLVIGSGSRIGINIEAATGDGIVFCHQNTVYDFTDGIYIETPPDSTMRSKWLIRDNLVYDVTNGIANASATDNAGVSCINNALGAVSSTRYNVGGSIDVIGDIVLTADPFTNAAGGDFSLNKAAGGGALVRGLALAPETAWGTRESYPSLGAIQPALGDDSSKPRTVTRTFPVAVAAGDVIRIRGQRSEGSASMEILANGASLEVRK